MPEVECLAIKGNLADEMIIRDIKTFGYNNNSIRIQRAESCQSGNTRGRNDKRRSWEQVINYPLPCRKNPRKWQWLVFNQVSILEFMTMHMDIILCILEGLLNAWLSYSRISLDFCFSFTEVYFSLYMYFLTSSSLISNYIKDINWWEQLFFPEKLNPQATLNPEPALVSFQTTQARCLSHRI